MDNKTDDSLIIEKEARTANPFSNEPEQVVVADIKVPFISLMWFMVKAIIAAIPAMVIATAILVFMFVAGLSFLDGLLGTNVMQNINGMR